MNDIQKLELEILVAIDFFCRNHDIHYSLIAGTLIGAVRHKGFIPWDDDIDLAMLRSEYDKFIEEVKANNNKIEDYIVVIPSEDNVFYPFVKVIDPRTVVHLERIEEMFPLGVWVDIFPFDYVGTDEFKHRKQMIDREKDTIRLLRFVAKDNNIFRQILRIIYLRISILFQNNWIQIRERLRQIPECGDRGYVGCFTWAINNTSIYPVCLFNSYSKIQFENCEFEVFTDYKNILEIGYGDYMRLPPVEKRQNHKITFEIIK